MNTSTKPFRRAGALVLTYFYLLFMTMYIAGCTQVAKLTGTVFVIDPIESPLLDRTRRILYARDTKKREKEMALAAKARETRQHAAITAMANEHGERKKEDQKHHKDLIQFWDGMFRAADAKEIAAFAERQRQKAIDEQNAFEERRQREMAMWQEAEKNRMALAVKKQAIEVEALQKKQKRTDPDDSSYGDRSVGVHAVYVRTHTNTKSKDLNHLLHGDTITVDGWAVGEELYGSSIWFHQKPGPGYLAGWIWGGALTNQSTSGLPRISDEIKITGARVMLSKNSENALEVLTQMHANPELHEAKNRIAALESEMAVAKKRIKGTVPTPLELQITASRSASLLEVAQKISYQKQELGRL